MLFINYNENAKIRIEILSSYYSFNPGDRVTLEEENEDCSNKKKTFDDLSTYIPVPENPENCANRISWYNSGCSNKFFYSMINGECSCEKEAESCDPLWTAEVSRRQINQYRIVEGNNNMVFYDV